MFGITLFHAAGATGHVFTLSRGTFQDRGIGWGGLIGPMTTVAVVPTIAQVVNFSVEAYSRDKQQITVSGCIQARLNGQVAKSTFDFTVDNHSGGYRSRWEALLQQSMIDQVLGPIRTQALELDISTAVTSQPQFEETIRRAIAGETNSLVARGVTIESCSVSTVEPSDDEVNEAIGSEEREGLLSAADTARHERRLKAADNERRVRAFEAETNLKLEVDRSMFVAEQGKNMVALAGSEAEATELRLKPMIDIDSGKLMAASLMVAAKEGKLGSVALTTELLAAVTSNGRKGG
ncbi:MAG: SPFH domain-containing protein [Patescibacteria group bacterium]